MWSVSVRKNLVLIHLESISNTILWQYRTELKTIWWMRQMSFVYNRFYTSATSTVMSVNHLRYGASDVYDSVSSFGHIYDSTHPENVKFGMRAGSAPGLDDIVTTLVLSGYNLPDRVATIKEFQILPLQHTGMQLTSPTHDEALPLINAVLLQASRDKAPFFLHYIPGITHITGEDKVKNAAVSFSDRFRLGYLRLDEQVRNVLAGLSKYELLDNTVVVFYGDHGDELWSHGLINGWCHVTTPYASLCWTPLFIYDKTRLPGCSDQLASSIDLRETLVKYLVPDAAPEKSQVPDIWKNDRWLKRTLELFGPPSPFKRSSFCGIDLEKETRKYAFSQSLMALQLEYNDPVEALLKGYAVTDGTYRLCVTSGGNEPRDGGLEFFCDLVDPTNHRNLLNFFKLDVRGDIVEFAPPPSASSREFELMFNQEAVEDLRKTYQEMKTALYDYVRDKEEQAKQHSVGTVHTLSDNAFKHMRKRPYKD